MFNKFPITEKCTFIPWTANCGKPASWGDWETTIILPSITASGAMPSTTLLSIISMWMTSMASSRTKTPAETHYADNDHRSKARVSRAGFALETR